MKKQEKNNNKVYKLIHTLNKVEKRRFRDFLTYTSRSSSKNNSYKQTYELYLKLKSFDNEVFDKKLLKLGFLKQKSHINHILYQKLLTFLSIENHNTKFLLEDALKQTKILMKRGLLEEALVVVQKAKKEAYLQDEYALLLQLNNNEKSIQFKISSYKKGSFYSIATFNEEHQKILNILQTIHNYTCIHWDFNARMGKYDFKDELEAQAYIQTLLSKPIVQITAEERAQLPKQIKFPYFRLIGFLYIKVKNYEKAYDVAQQYDQLLQKTKDLVPNEILIYYTECMFLYILLKKKEQAWNLWLYIDQLHFKDFIWQSKLVIYKYRRLFDYYRLLDLLHVKKEDILNRLKKDDAFISGFQAKTGLQLLYYSLIKLCMYKAWHKEAQTFIDVFNEIDETNLQQSGIYRIIRFYQLILYMESNIKTLVTSELRAISYAHEKLERKHQLDYSLIKYFTALNSCYEETHKQDILQKFQKEIQALPKNTQHYTEFDLEYIAAWLESKLTGKAIDFILHASNKNRL